MADDESSITRLLERMRNGDHSAESELFSSVYAQLRRVASAQMRSERPNHTLQPTALVHEAWLRLMQGGTVNAGDRDHFFRLAAQVMQRILTDHARARKAEKRWGGQHRVELDRAVGVHEPPAFDLLALEQALKSLHEVSPRQYQVVVMHFFGGLSFEAIAKILGIAERTTKRDWNSAKLWLHGQLYGWPDHPGALAQGQ